MKTDYEYIRFVEIPHEVRRTRIFDCYNKRSMDVLGMVFWYAAWRQYCFQPRAHTIYSAGCLADITNFIGYLMADHRATLSARKADARHNQEAQLAE
jgi:hypothetical protein